jgi:lipoate-protein ligase B
LDVNFRFLGIVEYQEALSLQQQFRADVLGWAKGIVLGLQHPEVITLGVRGDGKVDVLVAPSADSAEAQGAEQRDVPVVKTDRGGQATAHNPGQLVIYPIVQLSQIGLGAREFVELILNVTQATLREVGIEAEIPECHPGLYVKGQKIASIGLRISRGVTSHGIALNVNNDLSIFQRIRPCGVSSQGMTSVDIELSRLNRLPTPTVEAMFFLWQQAFLKALTPSLKGTTLDRSLRI